MSSTTKDFIRRMLSFMPDKEYLDLMYFYRFHKKIDWKSPKTFNEKIQWLKVNDRRPEYTKMVDKYEAKNYISKKIGNEYIIPTLGVWDRFDDIDFESLPNKFVLKSTHDSGGLVICKNKNDLDIKVAKNKIEKSLKRKFFYVAREWPYKNVEPKIIAEEFLFEKNNENEPIDNWKFYCCNGKIFVFYVTKGGGHSTSLRMTYFDENNNILPVRHFQYPPCEGKIVLPDKLDIMKECAEKLSVGIPLIRVDFYYVNNKVYIGELTLYPGAGFEPIIPMEYDKRWGDCIDLSLALNNLIL